MNEPPKTTNASELNKQEQPDVTSEETEVVVAPQSEVKAEEVAPTPPPPTPSTCASEIQKYDWNKTVAYNVMIAESSGNHLTVNNNPSTGDYSVGCFQVNLYGRLRATRPSEAWLKIPANNVAYAYGLYRANGWSPWGFTTCKYKVKCY